MDMFNKAKIIELEQTLKIYKERNHQLEQYEKKAKELELKVKCMKMYIDDDEAIDELLSAIKTKDIKQSEHDYIESRRASMAAQQQMSGLGAPGLLGQGDINRVWHGLY